MADEMRVVAMGVHVLDVLVRPVEAIPEGQGGALVEEIKVTAAGSAGGAAITLARLGAQVRSAGAIGTDAAGDMLLALLERGGVDTSLLVRREDVQTSASVLPIRPNGDRPAHVVGANATYGPADAPREELAGSTHLHLGGPEFMGGEAAAEILSRAREQGIVTSADLLAPGDMGVLEWIAAALPHIDYFFPTTSRCWASRRRRRRRGARGADRAAHCVVAATCGADGAVIVDAETVRRLRSRSAVDTTGCGDAFSAGFLRGLSLGRTRHDAATLGCATAALVAGGLGSDAGSFDLAITDEFAAATATR